MKKIQFYKIIKKKINYKMKKKMMMKYWKMKDILIKQKSINP